MRLRMTGHASFGVVFSAACLLTLPSLGEAHPSFTADCSTCHTNIAMSADPANGGTLDFGKTLVGQTSTKNFTITNTTDTSTQGTPGGGFTGTYSGASGAFTPTTSAGIAGGVAGGDGQRYLTPFPCTTCVPVTTVANNSDTRAYTFTPTTRGSQTSTVTFTATKPSVGTATITLQGQGVAPVLDTAQTNAGMVRIGAAGSASITVKNTGDGNQSGAANSNLDGTVGSASGAFSGSGGAFNLGDGASSAPFSFAFAPTSHGAATGSVNVTTTNGDREGTNNPDAVSITLTGTGVGPMFSAPTTLTFLDGVTSNHLTISNITLDGDLGALTNLTLLSAHLTGTDAGMFSVLNFTAGTLLHAGETFDLAIGFTPSAGGAHSAILTLGTDENAALGANGSEFTINLVATTVPEPGIVQLLLAGLIGITAVIRGSRRRRFSSMTTDPSALN